MNEPNPTLDPATSGGLWRRSAKIRFAVGAALALYVVFEIGRYTAGYSVLRARRERDVLGTEITLLKHDNRALQTHVVELQTVNAGHAHEEQVVTRTIAQLQAQIARQREKLAFYRGVVAPGAPPIGLRVGEVLLTPGKRPLHYHFHLSLLRTDRPDGEVSGTVTLTADGKGPGETTLDNHTLTGQSAVVKYRFRYYQEIKEDLVLPPGFTPAHLTVTVRSSRKSIAPLIQAYPWSAIAVP